MNDGAIATWIGSIAAVLVAVAATVRWFYRWFQRRERLDIALNGNPDTNQPGIFSRVVSTERLLADHIEEDRRIHGELDRRSTHGAGGS